MKTVANDLKEILVTLNQTSYGTKSFEELPETEQIMIANKLQLKKLIEQGHITDVEKANRWLELIELVNDWLVNNQEYNIEHYLHFYEDGSILIQSYREDYEDEFEVDFVNGKLLLNGESLSDNSFVASEDSESGSDSIAELMNVIEFNIVINS